MSKPELSTLRRVTEQLAEDMSLIENELAHVCETVQKMARAQNAQSEKISRLVIEYGEYAEEQSVALELLSGSLQQVLEKLRSQK